MFQIGQKTNKESYMRIWEYFIAQPIATHLGCICIILSVALSNPILSFAALVLFAQGGIEIYLDVIFRKLDRIEESLGITQPYDKES